MYKSYKSQGKKDEFISISFYVDNKLANKLKFFGDTLVHVSSLCNEKTNKKTKTPHL